MKSPTTPDVMSGVVAAMKSALAASGLAARGDRRRDDRHDAFHQRGRPAPRSRADRRGPARPPGDRLAAADGRLARGPEERDRQPRLSGARRPRIRRPRDFAARRSRAPADRRRHQGQGHPFGRGRRGVQPGQFRLRGEGRRDSRQGAARRACDALERHRPHRPARARKRGDHERLPARSRQARHRRLPRRARRLRRQGRASI